MSIEATEPEDYLILYRRAFQEYGTRALWNKRLLEQPTPADALVVARALRVEGTVTPDSWRNRSSRPAVPLTNIQTDALRLLAAHRDPES